MAKQDARVAKTKKALASAMLTLLERQDFQSITVNGLCAEAKVSRSTFYLHFQDKYALLEFCMGLMQQKLFPPGARLSLPRRLRDMLARVQANVRVFKNLMMVNYDEELYRRLRQSLEETMGRALAEKGEGPGRLPGPPEVISAYCTAGIANAVMQWVRSGMPCPVEELAACLEALLPKVAGAAGEEKEERDERQDLHL